MIEVQNLVKRYGGKAVVDDISFDCPPGAVTGFLGPNGAGKSTTLKMIVDFTRPDSGRALTAGAPYRDLSHPARSVGVMLDAAALHRGRTGSETLKLHAYAIGADPGKSADLLHDVGLAGSGKMRVRAYSLGMRQRLGIAVALIGDPQVLILDEPYNGLDPDGIYWIRSLVRDFARRGGTVLLSSHLLNEVTETVDRLVVITEGRVVAQGSMAELSSPAAVLVRASDPVALADSLRSANLEFTVTDETDFTVNSDFETVSAALHRDNVRILRLGEASRSSVEDLYFRLTEGAPRP